MWIKYISGDHRGQSAAATMASPPVHSRSNSSALPNATIPWARHRRSDVRAGVWCGPRHTHTGLRSPMPRRHRGWAYRLATGSPSAPDSGGLGQSRFHCSQPAPRAGEFFSAQLQQAGKAGVSSWGRLGRPAERVVGPPGCCARWDPPEASGRLTCRLTLCTSLDYAWEALLQHDCGLQWTSGWPGDQGVRSGLYGLAAAPVLAWRRARRPMRGAPAGGRWHGWSSGGATGLGSARTGGHRHRCEISPRRQASPNDVTTLLIAHGRRSG